VDIAPVVSALNGSGEAADVDPSCIGEDLEWLDTNIMPENSSNELKRSSDHFEVESTDGVSLSSNILAGLITDLPTIDRRHSLSPDPVLVAQPSRKRQRVDVSTIVY
jgi:hypothetical protein